MPPRVQPLASDGALAGIRSFVLSRLLSQVWVWVSFLDVFCFSFGSLLVGPAFLHVFFIFVLFLGLTFKAFFVQLFGLASLQRNASSEVAFHSTFQLSGSWL